MTRALKVAVIGAGTAGLATARELQREGHRVVVFEKADRIGGTWVYNPQVEADPLGLEPDREIVHSSLYYSLRTNLPRHLMGFSDYPFTIRKNGELNNFPGHEEMLKFLNNFARDFGLIELIRFNTEVVRVERESLADSHWVVESRQCDQFSREELFEAVVVCNGHYTQPRVAELPGIKKWPSKQIHSHNYRVPEPFRSQVVVVIGSGPSAFDISEDIAKVAKEVHLSSRSSEVNVSRLDTFDNVWQHSEVDYCYENGDVAFKDGALVAADVILYCTGYKYDYPFLRTNGIVTVDDNRVGPLYKHVFPPKLAPGLSFVGIPYMSMYYHNVEALERCFLLGLATKENMLKVVIFLMIELQAKWVVRVLSGKALLPSKEEMLADVEEHYRRMEENGVPKRHTHSLQGVVFEYLDWLANQAGLPPVDEIKQIYAKYFQIIGTSYPWIGRVRELDIESLIK